ANRVQLTSDGHKAYLDAVEGAFGGDIDYAQLVKLYGQAAKSGLRAIRIRSISARRLPSARTSRCGCRCDGFTRLTNAFSKKFENHMHMVALYTVWYNFVKLHKAHRMTPAMAAGVNGQALVHGGLGRNGGRDLAEGRPARSLQDQGFKLRH